MRTQSDFNKLIDGICKNLYAGMSQAEFVRQLSKRGIDFNNIASKVESIPAYVRLYDNARGSVDCLLPLPYFSYDLALDRWGMYLLDIFNQHISERDNHKICRISAEEYLILIDWIKKAQKETELFYRLNENYGREAVEEYYTFYPLKLKGGLPVLDFRIDWLNSMLCDNQQVQAKR